jgi:hypothetical protein
MKNKILLSAAILAATSTTIFAASETFQATVTAFQEPTIVQSTQLNFGKINPAVGSVCTMDNAGSLTGACVEDGNALGDILISNLSPSSVMSITVTGSDDGTLAFVPTATATGGAAPVNLADGVQGNFTTTAGSADVTLSVYGALTVGSTLTSGVPATADYTVDVTFQ